MSGHWSTSTSAGAAIVFLGDQSPVPTQDRIRGDDARDLRQNPPAEFVTAHSESTTLGVRQAKRPRAQVFSEDPILLPEIVDQIVLVTVHPASEREDEELQRRRHSLRLLGRLDQHRPSLGRFFAPYAVQLSSDQNVKGEFRNTRQGVMCATSVGGSATGKGGDRIIVDDLHNPQQADSDAQREAALRFFRETLSTRLDTPKTGAIVVVMQRLHEADLSARCLELGYLHLCLPVEADAATDIVFPVSDRVVTREPGHLLWPAREGRTELAIQRRQLGSTAFDTQYQQRPAPAGGRLFKRAWFKFYDERPRVSTWLASWDMSFKGGPSNDYVVGLQAAREGADVYLVDRVKGQWDFTETRRQVVRLHGRYPQTQTTLIEEAANGPAIINVLTRQIAGIIQSCPMAGSTLVPRRRYR